MYSSVDTANVGMQVPDRVLRCSRGHEWTVAAFDPNPGIVTVLPDETPYCLYCVREWMRDNLGVVQEIVSNGQEHAL